MREETGTVHFHDPERGQKKRIDNLWLSNAILEDFPVSRIYKRAKVEGIPPPYVPRPLRLDWPTEIPEIEPLSPNVPVEVPFKDRGRSRRFKRQYKPPEFKDGFSQYMPCSLWAIGDVRVTVARRWLGAVKLCFWAWRNRTVRRRPTVEKVQALVQSTKLKMAMLWWRRRFKVDRHIGIRVQWYEQLTKARMFEQMYKFARGCRSCKIVVNRLHKLRFSRAFFRWSLATMDTWRFNELVDAPPEQKMRMAFRALIAYGKRRTRVLQRADKWLGSMRHLLRRILVRWRNLTITRLTCGRIIMARFLPLKRKVFRAFKLDFYGPRRLRLIEDWEAKKRRPPVKERVMDVLAQPGRPPAYVSFKPLPASPAMEALRRRVAAYASGAIDRPTSAKTKRVKMGQGNVTLRTLLKQQALAGMPLLREEPVLGNGPLPPKSARPGTRLCVGEALNFRGMRVLTDMTQLHMLGLVVRKAERDYRRAVFLATGRLPSAYSRGQFVPSLNRRDGDDEQEDDEDDEEWEDEQEEAEEEAEAAAGPRLTPRVSIAQRPHSIAELSAVALQRKRSVHIESGSAVSSLPMSPLSDTSRAAVISPRTSVYREADRSARGGSARGGSARDRSARGGSAR